MKVICAGMPKTGTKSLAKALRILGLKVYDADEHCIYHMEEWIQAFETSKMPDLYRMYKDVDAATDVPPMFWYEELHYAFPEAKVILSVRDNADVWYESLLWNQKVLKEAMSLRVMLGFLLTPTGWKMSRMMSDMMNAAFKSTNPNAAILNKKAYREHNERVKNVIPKDKLLVFKMEQGWAPLCRFLEMAEPEIFFPYENVNSEDVKAFLHDSKIATKIYRELQIIIIVLFPIIAFIFYLIFYRIKDI
ncbi:uncharacterized protein LOC5512962 [Nematostella vectensis]|uniref:uncharacterized protein LOC5512962 n=1 Tax=Nematostella vectensis TaxID=45351 RepID=UPI00207765AD|nr:uncharacterized protein LOC5512962 [Nematostella vectensis]